MQSAMGAVDLPGAGQHAAVFVRVGVTEHQLLGVAPGGEERAVIRARPKLAADVRRIAGGVFEIDLEERNRHDAGIEVWSASSPSTPDSSETAQANGQRAHLRLQVAPLMT